MKAGKQNPDKELYAQLRTMSWSQLWQTEVPRFNTAAPEDRRKNVAVIRAVGVVFSESGSAAQKEEVRRWLLDLLHDSDEKTRRYAMSALPKIGAGPGEEAELLTLLRGAKLEREQKYVSRALEKIGGSATLTTLAAIQREAPGSLRQAEQKVKASLARAQHPSALRLNHALTNFTGLRLHLRGRRGLESFVRQEVEESARLRGKFRVAEVGAGLVALEPLAPFTLADLYTLRCFGTVGFVPANASVTPPAEPVEALAAAITSPASRLVFDTFTEGAIRYRLNFIARGHQRSLVRDLAARVYARCPEILNDAQRVTWTIDVQPAGRTQLIELRPNVTPDLRFAYRRENVAASSHPPLAACLARLAGKFDREIIWDPFCGSGTELVECALRGGIRALYGTDLASAAIDMAKANFAATSLKTVNINFTCADFRAFPASGAFSQNRPTLILTNPPMGKRVPLSDARKLLEDLFRIAAEVLSPGGRLVLANPLPMENPHPKLKLESRHFVDFGGFDCRLELYRKLPG
jgi:23S rRNA G2445 N2-methylase RlmL